MKPSRLIELTGTPAKDIVSKTIAFEKEEQKRKERQQKLTNSNMENKINNNNNSNTLNSNAHNTNNSNNAMNSSNAFNWKTMGCQSAQGTSKKAGKTSLGNQGVSNRTAGSTLNANKGTKEDKCIMSLDIDNWQDEISRPRTQTLGAKELEASTYDHRTTNHFPNSKKNKTEKVSKHDSLSLQTQKKNYNHQDLGVKLF